MTERELTGYVALCDDRGRLNPAATGWSRRPMLNANLRRAFGRKKKWDYWCVIAPEVVVSVVCADIDYAGLASVWVLDRSDLSAFESGMLKPLGIGFALPDETCTGESRVAGRSLDLSIEELADSTQLHVTATASSGEPVGVDLSVAKPAGHESLNVVIPWSRRRFQFTSKQNSRPATGSVTVGDRDWEIGGDSPAYGVQDLGRGIWPYSIRWNWASASGPADDGRLVGLQFGGKWTEGTGATENALCIDGHVTKISEELEWTYDWANPTEPWRVRTLDSDQIDVVLTPYFDRHELTDMKLLKTEVHQCFGTWTGTVRGNDGVPAKVSGIDGFAEEARNRW